VTSTEVTVQEVDGTHFRVPVGTDEEHIPDTEIALLSADPSGHLVIRHYELSLHPLQGMWLYTESGAQNWDHQPINGPDYDRAGHTPEDLRQLLRAHEWQ
jgi:hypothetical protein